MSTLEELKNAPAGSIARLPNTANIMVKGDPELEYPWEDLLNGPCTSEEVADLGFSLEPVPTTGPSTAREALWLAWDLAHPLREGQTIPANTEFILISDASLHMSSEGFDQFVEPGLVGIIRTLDPLPDPEPDWLDAPAVIALVDGWISCAKPQVFTRYDYEAAPSEWLYNGSEEPFRWQDLRDVTPLYPKGQDA